ncbi:MAG: DUF3526 domain-containing protein, partial [Bacteroidota bacterium]
YYLILRGGESILSNTLKMVGAWLVVGFILPATVLQWISMEKPANLMTDLIDAKRDKRQELFDLPDSVFRAKLVALFPEIPDSPAAQDSTKIDGAYSDSGCALVNELMKESIAPIEADNETKNNLVRNSYWLSPMTYFQNRFNAIAQTHYDDYQNYRSEIQLMIDKQIRSMVLDTWNDTEIDKQKYLDYHTSLKIDE